MIHSGIESLCVSCALIYIYFGALNALYLRLLTSIQLKEHTHSLSTHNTHTEICNKSIQFDNTDDEYTRHTKNNNNKPSNNNILTEKEGT